MNGAMLTIHSKSDLSEKAVTISHEEGAFHLTSDGVRVASSEHPKPLATYAWANGAREVRHAYDLKLAE